LQTNRRSEVRLRVLAVLAGVLVASVAIVGMADAGSIKVKASSKLSARVLPKHINPTSKKKAKYTWNVRGGLTYGQYCPNGAKVFPYCETVPKNLACQGKVTWIMKLGKSSLLADAKKTVGRGSAPITKSCTYSFKHHFPTSDFVAKRNLKNDSASRHVGVFFYMTFPGNTYLNGSKARQQEVIAKVLAP
jgi:hypothetical protein